MSTQKQIEDQFSILEQLTNRLYDGKIELDVWVLSAAESIKKLAILQATLGKGKALDESDLEIISEYLNSVFNKGEVIQREIDDTGKITKQIKTFGLKSLVKEVYKENITREELLIRIQLYGEHTRTLRSEFSKTEAVDKGYTEILNILNKTKTGNGINHSPLCKEATARGWQPIEEFVKTFGLAPRHVYCVCTQVYR